MRILWIKENLWPLQHVKLEFNWLLQREYPRYRLTLQNISRMKALARSYVCVQPYSWPIYYNIQQLQDIS